MNKSRFSNVMWGIVLLIVAAVLVLYKLDMMQIDVLPDIGLWQVLLGLLFTYSLFHSLMTKSYGGCLFSLAFLGMVFSHELHIEKLVPWTLLVVALLGSIAIDLIFGKSKKHYYPGHGHNHSYHRGSNVVETETIEADVIDETISFTGVTKYIHSDNFTEANLDCSFCGAEFFFDNVTIPSGKAVINIKSNFCGVSLYIPKSWEIIDQTNSFLGAVDIDNRNVETPVATVVIKGSNNFAGVEIKRV